MKQHAFYIIGRKERRSANVMSLLQVYLLLLLVLVLSQVPKILEYVGDIIDCHHYLSLSLNVNIYRMHTHRQYKYL